MAPATTVASGPVLPSALAGATAKTAASAMAWQLAGGTSERLHALTWTRPLARSGGGSTARRSTCFSSSLRCSFFFGTRSSLASSSLLSRPRGSAVVEHAYSPSSSPPSWPSASSCLSQLDQWPYSSPACRSPLALCDWWRIAPCAAPAGLQRGKDRGAGCLSRSGGARRPAASPP